MLLWITPVEIRPDQVVVVFDKDNLGDNSIGNEGAKALADVIRASNSLAKLLYGNGIGDEGAKAITEAIGARDSMTELSALHEILFARQIDGNSNPPYRHAEGRVGVGWGFACSFLLDRKLVCDDQLRSMRRLFLLHAHHAAA